MDTCKLCGSKNLSILYKFTERDVLECRNCNLMFIDLDNFSSKDYYDSRYSEAILNDFRPDMAHKDYASLMLSKVSRFKKQGKILDVGCGPGIFLDHARSQGWQTYGVEITENNFRYAKDILRINVLQADAESIEFKDDFFDVITMFDILEHIKDPVMLLRKINRFLKKDGLLCIETPNSSSIYHCLLTKKWISFSEPSHIFFFCYRTLIELLRKSGFKVIFAETANVNFFSKEGLQRFRLYSKVYDIKLLVEKAIIFLSKNRIQHNAGQSVECRGIVEITNWPTNFVFNRLMMGDQLRVFVQKDF